MIALIYLTLIHLAGAEQALPPGISCNSQQSQCCLIDMTVKKCKAAAISEGHTPEMTAEESQQILGTGAKSASMMNCIANEKKSAQWKSAHEECQHWLDSCISACGRPDMGGWDSGSCKKAVEPIMALIDGAKAESDVAVDGSKDTLKALTGGDAAAVNAMLADARQKLSSGDRLQGSAAAADVAPAPGSPSNASPSSDQIAASAGGRTNAAPAEPSVPFVAQPHSGDQVVAQPAGSPIRTPAQIGGGASPVGASFTPGSPVVVSGTNSGNTPSVPDQIAPVIEPTLPPPSHSTSQASATSGDIVQGTTMSSVNYRSQSESVRLNGGSRLASSSVAPEFGPSLFKVISHTYEAIDKRKNEFNKFSAR